MRNFSTKNEKIDVLYDRPSEKYFIFSEKERKIVIISLIYIFINVYRQEKPFSKNLIYQIEIL